MYHISNYFKKILIDEIIVFLLQVNILFEL